MGTEAIHNYRTVSDRLVTGGQPTAEQLKSAAEEGFATVINLATINPRYSLYAMKHLGWSQAQADEFRASIWEGSNYPVWERFIDQMKAKIG